MPILTGRADKTKDNHRVRCPIFSPVRPCTWGLMPRQFKPHARRAQGRDRGQGKTKDNLRPAAVLIIFSSDLTCLPFRTGLCGGASSDTGTSPSKVLAKGWILTAAAAAARCAGAAGSGTALPSNPCLQQKKHDMIV